MPKEEIIAGLKQAIERGYSLNLAKQSFINAGYNAKEVEEASLSLGGVITEFPQLQEIQKPGKEIRQPLVTQPQLKQPATKKSKIKIIITIIVIILAIIFIAFLGILFGVLFYPDATKEFVKDILSFLP